jgi:hypothetical protein
MVCHLYKYLDIEYPTSMPSVILYKMPQVVQLTESGAVSVSTVINRTDFNLFKHVTNEVEFLIKTVDRKPINLTGLSLTIYVVNDATNQVVAQENLTDIGQDPKGHRRLVLDPFKVQELTPGFYRYSITIQRADGSQVLVYTDQNRSLRGFLEVFDGPLPSPQGVIEILPSDFVSDRWGNPLQEHLVAQSYPGAAQRANRSGLHNLALYTDNWSGEFFIEASIENGAPQDVSDWFPVSDFTLNSFTGVKSIQFTGNYLWVRFYFIPAVNNVGTITKVLLKN